MNFFAKSLVLVTGLAASSGALAAPAGWQTYSDPVYGTRALVPTHLLASAPSEAGLPGQAFLSADGQARLAFAAWDNADRLTPAAFKKTMLAQGDYSRLTYQPRGRGWFVLSGYRGQKVYYHKVIYSCGGQVINAFGMTYPVAQRAVYDPIVERIEDTFRAGRRC